LSCRPVIEQNKDVSTVRLVASVALAVLLALPPAASQAAAIKVVAAENFYGGIAAAIGGDRTEVVSILSNPAQDPHLFEASPAVVRRLADARVVIVNGADYDPWAEKLLHAAPRADRTVISVARLIGRKPGENPHFWYDPTVMPAVAKAIAAALSEADPAHAGDYATRLSATLAALDRVAARVTRLRAKYSGTPVTATEPVFGPMADALGLVMRNQSFQTAMMNDTEPGARDLAAFETDLKQRRVRALIYNAQVSEKLTERLLTVARKARVPVVAVTEMQPPGVTFADWMLGQLGALDKALAEPGL
jgi:zinc/manganese transport system substrate-binding protein